MIRKIYKLLFPIGIHLKFDVNKITTTSGQIYLIRFIFEIDDKPYMMKFGYGSTITLYSKRYGICKMDIKGD